MKIAKLYVLLRKSITPSKTNKVKNINEHCDALNSSHSALNGDLEEIIDNKND